MTEKLIRIMENGPYFVSRNVHLDQIAIESDSQGVGLGWGDGEYYHPEGDYYLCRCGHSKKKPFCDGSHITVHFVGQEVAALTPYEESATRLQGPELTLLDQENLCAGARFCTRGKTIWHHILHTDKLGYKKLAIYEATLCPSGRLTVVRENGEKIEPALAARISLIQDPARNCRGPLFVQGGLPIEGADGRRYEVRNRVTLCRCGASRNMPFCDGNHLHCPHMKGKDK